MNYDDILLDLDIWWHIEQYRNFIQGKPGIYGAFINYPDGTVGVTPPRIPFQVMPS